MVFPTICAKVADSTLAFRILIPSFILAFVYHASVVKGLDAYEDGPNLPDARIAGYTPAELNLWYDNIGVEGCKIYIRGANADFFPVMAAYPFFLGTMLIKATRTAGLPQNIAYLALVTVLLDAVETYIQREGCVVYPERLSDDRIALAANACRIKWVLLLSSMLLIAVLYIRDMMSAKPSEPQLQDAKKD